MTSALVIFVLTYLAIAAGRVPWLSVDRPAAALLGAVMMVATGVLTPAEAGAAVNGDTLGLLLGMMILAAYLGEAWLLGFPLAWTALFAAALCMAVAGRAPREALARVDWPLLMFFAGLFVVVAGVGRAGLAERLYQSAAPFIGAGPAQQAVGFGLFSAAASQVVSNVPFVLLAAHWIPRMAEPELLWLSTALCSTLAGNLTVVGSVANLIVLESAGPKGRIGFWRFLRFGAVETGATLALSLGLLLAERRVGLLGP